MRQMKTKGGKQNAKNQCFRSSIWRSHSLVALSSRVQMSALLFLALVTECQKHARVLQGQCVLCGRIDKICHNTLKNVLTIMPVFTLLRFLFDLDAPTVKPWVQCCPEKNFQ